MRRSHRSHVPWFLDATLVTLVCGGISHASPQQTIAPPHSPAVRTVKSWRCVDIGDFGLAGPDELAVANLVHALAPDIVITGGDNNYNTGAAATIDVNIGQYYHDLIAPYTGAFGRGAARNRFFPSLGNHDWLTLNAAPYKAYFTLPGNERYYDFVEGPVHYFAVDSDFHEPDGTSADSVQAAWLQSALAASTSPFDVVYFHHSAYSSGPHGSDDGMRWPFREWGADLVLSGHDHLYERIVRDGFPYIINGLGGAARYAFDPPIACSQVRYNADFGALTIDSTDERMTLRFMTASGYVADTITLVPGGVHYNETDVIAAGADWAYLDDGSDAGTAWRELGFNASSWATGPAPLGYGDGDEATVVSFGPDPNAKHITTYFRRRFKLADPAAYRAYRIELVRDDGAVVYLNGVEVQRTNMPDGTIDFTTTALSAVDSASEDAFYSVDVPAALFRAGTNALAVELHQRSSLSSDVSFDARVVGTPAGPALSPAGATWKYLDDGSNPGLAWKASGFDDSMWAAGPAQLGYGDGDEATVVSFGPDPNAKHITTYFRRSFSVPNAARIPGLLLRLLRDDGATVYLNGTEVFRMNLPAASTLPSSTAELELSGSDESTFVESLIDARLLVDGVNWIAVELHQFSAQSADLSFDLELLGL